MKVKDDSPTWKHKVYSHSLKLLKNRIPNPENLFSNDSRSSSPTQPRKERVQIINKSILRDRYEDMVDQVVRLYAEEEHIRVHIPNIARRNQYKNYRIVEPEVIGTTSKMFGSNLERKLLQDNAQREIFQTPRDRQERSLKKKSCPSQEKEGKGDFQVKLPYLVGSEKRSLQKKYISPRRQELKVLKIKLLGGEGTAEISSLGMLQRKYLGKYTRMVTEI